MNNTIFIHNIIEESNADIILEPVQADVESLYFRKHINSALCPRGYPKGELSASSDVRVTTVMSGYCHAMFPNSLKFCWFLFVDDG